MTRWLEVHRTDALQEYTMPEFVSARSSEFSLRAILSCHFRTERLFFIALAIPGGSGIMTLDLIAKEKHRVELAWASKGFVHVDLVALWLQPVHSSYTPPQQYCNRKTSRLHQRYVQPNPLQCLCFAKASIRQPSLQHAGQQRRHNESGEIRELN
jgi:hypothetical protein